MSVAEDHPRFGSIALVLSAAVLLAGCERPQPPPEGIRLARLARTPAPTAAAVPAAELRDALHDAYRLHPDRRFLLAFGEIRRLARHELAPSGTAATATFSGGRWTIRLDESSLGTLPELPDFPDYLALLVTYSKSAVRQSGSPRTSPGDGRDVFLMPGLLHDLLSAEGSWNTGPSFPDAARCFARLTFQMHDRLEVAPVIPGRALALLSVARSRDGHAGIEEEVLLAHALGYTRHAETTAATLLPEGSPLRLFEALEDQALRQMASKPDSSEEARFLALERATAAGDVERWKEARALLFSGNDSPSVIGTGLDMPLPAQLEVSEQKQMLAASLSHAVLRELGEERASAGVPDDDRDSWLDAKLDSAATAAKGPLWNGAAVTAYYETTYHAGFDYDAWLRGARERWPTTRLGATLRKFMSGIRETTPGRERAGAPLPIASLQHRLSVQTPPYPEKVAEIRSLVPWLDSRPAHRSEFAQFTHDQLLDIRAADDLHRSIVRVLGDGSRVPKARSALYTGDWKVMERLLEAPQITAPETSAILWNWYVSQSDPDRLEREFRHAIEKFPGDWNITSYSVDFLRERKKYREACEIVERWLRRNTDPRTPGHFHAHVRLAHNYVLAHEYEKARKLLDGMTETDRFQEAIRRRGLAESLAGLGRLTEAEKMSREAVREVPWDPENTQDYVRILWAEEKDREAAETLANPPRRFADRDTCATLADGLVDVFLGSPAKRLANAVAAVAAQPALSKFYRCASSGFAKAGRWEQAFQVSSQFSPLGNERVDLLITQYEYMKNWKGRETAANWLKTQFPAGGLNPLSMKALYTKNDDLLWDVIVTPDEKDHPEWVWLFRACAYALRGSNADAHHPDLLAYYGKDNPHPYHVMGRYLIGLASEADMFALLTNPQRSSEVAYYLGARAQGEKRFRDACDWYRVAAEAREPTSPRALALYTLGEWAGLRQGIWKLEANSR